MIKLALTLQAEWANWGYVSRALENLPLVSVALKANALWISVAILAQVSRFRLGVGSDLNTTFRPLRVRPATFSRTLG
jgi:hypothetical protein